MNDKIKILDKEIYDADCSGKTNSCKKSNRGFSLVELIVVILIIAIIAVALAPACVKYVKQARINTMTSNVAAIERTVSVVQAEFGMTDISDYTSAHVADAYKDFDAALFQSLGEDTRENYVIGLYQNGVDHERHIGINYFPDGVNSSHYYYFMDGELIGEYDK